MSRDNISSTSKGDLSSSYDISIDASFPSSNSGTSHSTVMDMDDPELNFDGDLTSDEEGGFVGLHIAEIKLIGIMTKFSLPNKAYEIIMEWAKSAVKDGFDFSNARSYRGTMSKILSQRPAKHVDVKSEFVKVGTLPKQEVHVFPFLTNVKRLLKDQELMEESNWRYDSGHDVCGDLNTGDWWKEAEENMFHSLSQFGITRTSNHYLVPVVLFIDATHCDIKGCLQAEPVLCTIGNISLEYRRRPVAWFILGLMPRKALSPAECEERMRKVGKRSELVEVYHACLHHILAELISLQEQDALYGCGTKAYVHGKGDVILHFELALVIGDTVGHDTICGRYRSYSNKIKRPIWSCDVSQDDIDDPDHVCSYTKVENIRSLLDECIHNIKHCRDVGYHRKQAASVSQCLVYPAFFDVSCGGDPHGIFGITPFESLHTLLLGMMKHSLQCLFEEGKHTSEGHGLVGGKGVFESSEFERQIRVLSLASNRQSDRIMPQCMFTTGVTTLSCIRGHDYVGLSLLTIAALPGMLNNIQQEKGYMQLLWEGICLYASLNWDSMPREELSLLHENIKKYLHTFLCVAGPQCWRMSPSVGTKFPCFHGMLHFKWQMEHFGSSLNFLGSYLESSLKVFIKQPAQWTRKTHSNFASDLVSRWVEYQTINEICSEVGCETMESLSKVAGKMDVARHVGGYSNDVKLAAPRFSFICTQASTWSTKYSGKIKDEIYHPDMPWCEGTKSVVRNFLRGLNDVNEVFCHYALTITNKNVGEEGDIFRCNPKFRGRQWFDWAMIEWESERGSGTYDSPARIHLLMSFLEENNVTHGDPQVFALIQSLRGTSACKYTFLPAWDCDILEEGMRVVNFHNSVKSVAYVLPGIEPGCQLNHKMMDDVCISDCSSENKFFIVLPPMSVWPNLST